MATTARRTGRTSTATRARKLFALYWCTTEDGDEDWFVVANTARAACRFHEEAEGYDRGDAQAERIVQLPPDCLRGAQWKDPARPAWSGTEAWPSRELLAACGGQLAPLPRDPMRERLAVVCSVVRFGSRVFRAGDIVTNVTQRLGRAAPARLALFRGERA